MIKRPRLHVEPFLRGVGSALAATAAPEFGGAAHALGDLHVVDERATAPAVLAPVGRSIEERFAGLLWVAKLGLPVDVLKDVDGVGSHSTSPRAAIFAAAKDFDDLARPHGLVLSGKVRASGRALAVKPARAFAFAVSSGGTR